MAEVWKSKDLTVELGATDIAGVYNLAIKSPYIEIRDLDGNPIRNRVVERSFGISKVPYITDHGSTVYDRYMEIYKEAIPEGYADYCLHGYFASWAKNISFDRDSGCNIVTRNWTINKIFKLKNLGSGSASYDFDEPSDSGILTTGGFKVYWEDDHPCLMVYNTEDGELFDFILNSSSRGRTVSFYGKSGVLHTYIYNDGLGDIQINNRDFIQSKLNSGYRLGLFGHYTKGSTTLPIESTVLPDGLPDDITSYHSLRAYAFDQLSKYQIYESDVDNIYVALYQKDGDDWERVEEEIPISWYIDLKNVNGVHTAGMYYAEYGSTTTKTGSDIPREFFDEDLEVRMDPFSGYPQFQIGDRTLVRFKERITPFHSYVPYDNLVVDNYEKVSDTAIQFDVTIIGLSVSELDVATTFNSTVKSTEVRSMRSYLRYTAIHDQAIWFDYADGEHPYTADQITPGTIGRVRDKVYLESNVSTRIYGGWSTSYDYREYIGEPKLCLGIPMSSDTVFYPYIKKITLIAPYQEHLEGAINVTRNGDAVGSIEVDQLDYRSTFTYERINNDVDVDASYSIITEVIEDGRPRPHFETTNATLKARFYDHTRIKFADNSGMEIDPAEALKNMTINVTECLGANRKSVTFNMATREILIDGVETGETCDDFIFYDTFLTYNSETQQYEMSIYIAARCGFTNEKGFNDSIVTVTYNSVRDGEVIGTSTLKYRTVLPPFILQGVPYKQDPAEVDSVFPNEAERPDIGYDPDTDSYVIHSYAENSQGYDRDFFFAARQRNADIEGKPLYLIPTSGFITRELAPNYEFSDCDAYLVNNATESKIKLEQEDMTVHENVDTVEVLTQPNITYCGTYNVVEWTHRVEAPAKGFYKNVATVSAAVVEV